MKKAIAVLLTASMFAFTLAGCSSSTTETTEATTEVATEEVAEEATEEAATETVEAEIVLRLADTLTEEYPATAGAIYFAELVEEYSEGRIVVEVYTGGTLGGDEATIVEQLQFGGIDIARLNISPVAEVAPMLNLLQLPFLFTSTEHMYAVIDSEIGTEMLASVEAEGTGMIGLCLYEAGTRNIYNSVQPITCLDDLQGLKIRVPQNNLMLDTFNALGANATALGISEVYSALQTGVIDGAENNNPSYQQMSHFEVAQYITMDAHTAPPEILVFSEAIWDGLTADDQAIITQAALDSVDYQREVFADTEAEALEIAIEGGAEVTYLDDISEFQDAVSYLWEEYAADYMDTLADIQAMEP